MNKHKFANILSILPFVIPVIFIMLFAVVYPKKIDVQSIQSTLAITEDKKSIRLDNIYPFEKFYDYQVQFENNILKIFVRKSSFIKENWPQIIEIENDKNLKEIRLMGANGSQTIYSR